jgi:HD-GYP domain-containing protein (c-di-GMP phosphodiesterase class II)
MLRVSVMQARPGMVLALPVVHPKCTDVVLLRENVALDALSISRLQEIKPPELWIKYPRLEFLAEYVSPHVFRACAQITHTIGHAFDAVSRDSGAKLEYHEYKRAVGDLLERLAEEPKAQLFIREIVDGGRPALRHATNVCMLSVLMGLRLEFYLLRERSKLGVAAARDVSNLGVGAMLHDVGMTRLDEQTLARWNTTHDESDPEFRRHVQIGYGMVQGQVEPSAAAVVLGHHERYDGTGFPAKNLSTGRTIVPSGSDIHIFARIVAVADVFDRLKHGSDAPGPGAGDIPPMPTVRALKLMQNADWAPKLDPIVFKALLTVVPAYAPGTLVTLSNGKEGVVIDWSPLDPCRPTVEIIGSLERPRDWEKAKPGEVYHLADHPDLHVVTAEGQDVSQDNFYPAKPSEFDLAKLGKAMGNAAEQTRAA